MNTNLATGSTLLLAFVVVMLSLDTLAVDHSPYLPKVNSA
jgi:hypothetical protein